MSNKRGISELIAIVLLVGFVIVLAILVLAFGGGFLEKLMKGAESQAGSNLCVNLNIKIIQKTNDIHSFDIINNNNLQIENFIVNWYSPAGIKVGGYDINEIEKFDPDVQQGLKNNDNFYKFPILPYDKINVKVSLKGTGYGGEVEFIPLVSSNKRYVVCPENRIRIKYSQQQIKPGKELIDLQKEISNKIFNIFTKFAFPWENVLIPKADITSKYKCNGIEFNINDIVGFSFSIYENKPHYLLDIDYNPNEEKYCPWCYNRIQDYDEKGVDCGGSCAPCVENIR